ncbi:MAG TPA: hypothetical protein V6C76_15650 [Drouetiella sp.]
MPSLFSQVNLIVTGLLIGAVLWIVPLLFCLCMYASRKPAQVEAASLSLREYLLKQGFATTWKSGSVVTILMVIAGMLFPMLSAGGK